MREEPQQRRPTPKGGAAIGEANAGGKSRSRGARRRREEPQQGSPSSEGGAAAGKPIAGGRSRSRGACHQREEMQQQQPSPLPSLAMVPSCAVATTPPSGLGHTYASQLLLA